MTDKTINLLPRRFRILPLLLWLGMGALCHAIFLDPIFNWQSAWTWVWLLLWPMMLFFLFWKWALIVIAAVIVIAVFVELGTK